MNDSHLLTAAEDVWMRAVARELGGEAVEFEGICAERPKLAVHMRHLRAAWTAASDTPETAAVRCILLRTIIPQRYSPRDSRDDASQSASGGAQRTGQNRASGRPRERRGGCVVFILGRRMRDCAVGARN